MTRCASPSAQSGLVGFRWRLLRIAEDGKNVTWPEWPHLGLCLVSEIDNLRFIERDATIGSHEMALMYNFLLARHSGATPKCRVLRGAQ
jgi:hypothetical protein